jgi:hypothetical protein
VRHHPRVVTFGRSIVKEQAFNFMWDGINWKKGVNILLTNN